jgi:flavin reductase (DIM6/NTAB) family NADH-FMN oxidoreductase RutF
MTRPRTPLADQRQPARGPADGRALRRALGRFVTGVTVLSTVTADADGVARVHGMTANAFTSVSLRPPLVLVSVARSAAMDARIARAGRYAVSVLAEGQRALALRFAGRSADPTPVEFDRRDGLPVVAGALAWLTCSVRTAYQAGDHTLYLGAVDQHSSRAGAPLVFYASDFRALAGIADPNPWWC